LILRNRATSVFLIAMTRLDFSFRILVVLINRAPSQPPMMRCFIVMIMIAEGIPSRSRNCQRNPKLPYTLLRWSLFVAARLSLHVYSRGPPLFSDEGRKRIRALSLIESDTISENNRCLLECSTKKAPAYLGDFVKSPLSCARSASARAGGKKGRPGKNLGSNYLLIPRSYQCARPLNRFSRLARLIISGFNAPL